MVYIDRRHGQTLSRGPRWNGLLEFETLSLSKALEYQSFSLQVDGRLKYTSGELKDGVFSLVNKTIN